MADLIDREELLNSRPEYRNPQMGDEIASARNQGWNDCNSYYYNLITKQPTVDTKRHTHWEYVSCGVIQCSNCKEKFMLIGQRFGGNGYTYCPCCGCRMDGVTNNDG